jgi:hypothetical protein
MLKISLFGSKISCFSDFSSLQIPDHCCKNIETTQKSSRKNCAFAQTQIFKHIIESFHK